MRVATGSTEIATGSGTGRDRPSQVGQQIATTAMAGRTRHSSVPIQDEEPRRTANEQQRVPAAQVPPAPPPPPMVDYGTFMHWLVQVMQTQAQAQAALQTQLQAQVPAPAQQDHSVGGVSIMERFKRMVPPSFKGASQRLVAESCLREI
ncbi:hypothetical protein Taro_033865 [Colocasia esculenta]|uniref:Uncharacterized protein n=1 Tax=Colocasia esculenta TaxID=4460 RepID=A0A843VZ42_COLES|nr:hypothetical protein [Colocasia esculenta]